MSEESKTAGDTPVLAPTLRERLKDGAPLAPVTEKPAAKSRAIPAWMARQYKAGGGVDHDGATAAPTHNAPAWLVAEMPPAVTQRPASSRSGSGGSGIDSDGQVLAPSDEQRAMASRLNGMFPRGSGV